MTFPKRDWLGVQEAIAIAAICAFEKGVWMIYKPAAYLCLGAILFAAAWFGSPTKRSS